MSGRRDIGKIRFAGEVVTRSTAHVNASSRLGAEFESRPQMNADQNKKNDLRNPRLSVAKKSFIGLDLEIHLEREPQLHTNRPSIINSLLRETEVIAAEIVVGIHGCDHWLT